MMFGWCMDGKHKDCIQTYQRFYFEKNKIIWLDEWRVCSCKTKGCPCASNDAAPVAPKQGKRKA